MKLFKLLFIITILFFSGFFVFEAKADYEGTVVKEYNCKNLSERLEAPIQENDGRYKCPYEYSRQGYVAEGIGSSKKCVLTRNYKICNQEKITKGDRASITKTTTGRDVLEIHDSGGNVVKYSLDNTVGVALSFLGNVFGGFNSSKTENTPYVFDIGKYVTKWELIKGYRSYIPDRPQLMYSTFLDNVGGPKLYNVEKKEECSGWGLFCSTSTNFNYIADLKPDDYTDPISPCISWSACSVSCGGGAQYCVNPNDPNKTQQCNAQTCPTPTPACSPLTYSSDHWEERYFTYPDNVCLGERTDYSTGLTFDIDWADREIDFGRKDNIQFSIGRIFNFNAGVYKFTLGSDDGSKLYIDSTLCVDNWGDHGYKEESCNKSLSAGNHKFRIDWYENGGSARISSKYELIPPPTITYFNASGGELPYASNSRSIGLSWGSSNADSCIAGGNWSGNKSASGYESLSPKPRGNYSFSLTCTGIGGSDSKSVGTGIISVPKQNSNKLFSGNPSQITPPDSSTLSWDIDHATSCSIDQGIGSVCNNSGKGLDYCNGSKEVRPTQDTTYTLTCQGLDGSRDFQTVVKIKTPGRIIYQEVAPW